MLQFRSFAIAALAAAALSATAASAEAGSLTNGYHGRRPNVLGSNRASNGINAVAPSRATLNGSGKSILRRMGIRHARIQR